MIFVLAIFLCGMIAAALALHRYLFQPEPCALCNQPNRDGHACRFRVVVRVAKQVRRAYASDHAPARTLLEGWLVDGKTPFWRCQHLHGDKAEARACAEGYLGRCQRKQARLIRRIEPRQITRSRALQRVVIDKPPRPSREIPVR